MNTLTASCDGDGPERVFQWTPDQGGLWNIDTCRAETDFDTVVHLREEYLPGSPRPPFASFVHFCG